MYTLRTQLNRAVKGTTQWHRIEILSSLQRYRVSTGRSGHRFCDVENCSSRRKRSQSAQAPVTIELPRDVVAEAIVNAVARRDYTSNASVQVMLFADRLEITNPGELPGSLTLEALRHPHNSVSHNPLVAEGLYLKQYIERMGTGTGDMIRLCTEAGLAEPEFSIRGGFVTTIWRKPLENRHLEHQGTVKPAEKISEKISGKIVELMRASPEISIPEIALQLQRTERTIQRLIRELREQEVTARVGPAKGRHW